MVSFMYMRCSFSYFWDNEELVIAFAISHSIPIGSFLWFLLFPIFLVVEPFIEKKYNVLSIFCYCISSQSILSTAQSMLLGIW